MKKQWWKWALPFLLYLFLSWYYPYSWWSLHQSYDYQADSVFAGDYNNKIKAFQQSYTKNPSDPFTTQTTAMAVDTLFTEKWLTSENSVTVPYAYLETIQQDAKNVRQALVHLDRKGPAYTPHAQDQLNLLIDTLEGIQDEAGDIQDMRNRLMRPGADNVLNNLHVSIAACADMLMEFYRAQQNGE